MLEQLNNPNISGTVVEVYDFNHLRQVVTIRYSDNPAHLYFFLPKVPTIGFGDKITGNLETGRFFVHFGNPRLTFALQPDVFPDTLLIELITERINL